MPRLNFVCAGSAAVQKKDVATSDSEQYVHPELGKSPWFPRMPTVQQFQTAMQKWSERISVRYEECGDESTVAHVSVDGQHFTSRRCV